VRRSRWWRSSSAASWSRGASTSSIVLSTSSRSSRPHRGRKTGQGATREDWRARPYAGVGRDV
jgi:hypothetical protein